MVRSIKNCLFLYVPVAIRVAIPAAVSGRTHSPGSLPDHSLHGGRERGKGPVRRPFAAVGDLERCHSLQKRAADRLPAFRLRRQPSHVSALLVRNHQTNLWLALPPPDPTSADLLFREISANVSWEALLPKNLNARASVDLANR
jgi:hypothetical protein